MLCPGLGLLWERHRSFWGREWEINTPSHYRLMVACCSGLFIGGASVGDMEVGGSVDYVVGWGVVFGEVVCKIAFTRAPVDCELSLFFTVS